MSRRVRAASVTPPSQYRQEPCPTCGQLRPVINGPWLRWCRESAGLDQRRAAALFKVSGLQMSISGPYLSDIERNRRVCPEAIAKAYARMAGMVSR